MYHLKKKFVLQILSLFDYFMLDHPSRFLCQEDCQVIENDLEHRTKRINGVLSFDSMEKCG